MKRLGSSPISRRTILRSAGVSVALPFLPSLAPRPARAQAATRRFVALFFPNGSTQRQDWALGGNGTSYTLGTAHASLVPFKAKLSMLKNLNGSYSGAPDHSRGTAEFLTAAAITDMASPRVALSIDQAMVNLVQPNTSIRSLHLGPTPYPVGRPSDTGWPSGYNLYISWSSPTAPNAALEDAQVAFDRVFTVSGGDPAQQALAQKRLRLRTSVLDYVVDQVNTIAPRLGKDDGKKLGEYLTSIRDVESRLQAAAQQTSGSGSCMSGARPAVPPDFEAHTRAMFDVLTLALQCDATRFATYSIDYGFGTKDDGHHNLSHSGNTQALYDQHKAIVKRYMDRLAYFLGKLEAVNEGGATLLDNSIVYMGSDLGEAWSHSHQNLTAIVAGKGAGALNPGRLVDAAGHRYANFLLALGQAMAPQMTSFGGSSTPMPGL